MMRSGRVFVAVSACAVLLAVSGCAGGGKAATTTERPPVTTPDDSAASGSALSMSVKTQNIDEVFGQAADLTDAPVFKPSWVPDGFRIVPEECSLDGGGIMVIFGKGTDRIVYIQGGWDAGDAGPAIGKAMFGSMQGDLLAMKYMSEGPAYGRDGHGVLVYTEQGNYGLIGTGVTADDIKKMAAELDEVR